MTPGRAPLAAAPDVVDDRPPGLVPPKRRRRSSKRIGEVIVELGFVRQEIVDAAVASAREQGRQTGQLLVEMGALRPDQLARALADRLGLDYLDLSVFDVDPAALDLIAGDLAQRYSAVPVGFLDDGSVVLAMVDPTNVLTIDEISMITGRKVVPAAAAQEDLAPLIARYSPLGESDGDPEPEPEPVELELGRSANDAPVIRLVHQVIGYAVQRGASDIHFNPEGGGLQVLLRVDGVLIPSIGVSRSMAGSVVSRIKIMAGLNIAEKRVPQDGRTRVTIDGRNVDVRVVTLPLVGGEGVVMRILDTGAVVRELRSLGVQDQEYERLVRALAKPYGAVLVTGPTGSGKSTTLYSGLAIINDGERSIVTIEDPVESSVQGIKQMQVSAKTGLTFATGLRSVLRADPDVIMVGEIRDRETAEIAIQSALTGHLMLSTLHTRDAPSAISRLSDMRIEPFMLAAALDCVVAQRLARMLCEHCKLPAHLSPTIRAEYGLGDDQVFEPAGCSRCGGSGYAGRIGLFEVMTMSDEIRTIVLERRGIDELAAAAARGGMRTMREDGLSKVRQGLTSLAEISRVTSTI